MHTVEHVQHRHFGLSFHLHGVLLNLLDWLASTDDNHLKIKILSNLSISFQYRNFKRETNNISKTYLCFEAMDCGQKWHAQKLNNQNTTANNECTKDGIFFIKQLIWKLYSFEIHFFKKKMCEISIKMLDDSTCANNSTWTDCVCLAWNPKELRAEFTNLVLDF